MLGNLEIVGALRASKDCLVACDCGKGLIKEKMI